MVLDGDRAERRQRGRLTRASARSGTGAGAPAPSSPAVERPALVPDRVRDAEPAEVVDEPGPAHERRRPPSEQPEVARRRAGEVGDAARVADASTATSGRRSRRSPRARRRARSSESTIASAGSASITASQVVTASRSRSSVGASAQNDLHQRRVELRAAALAGDRDRRLDAAARGGRPRRRRRGSRAAPRSRISSPFSLGRHALAVPALERLRTGVAHLRAEAERARELVRRAASGSRSSPRAARRPAPMNATPTRARCQRPRARADVPQHERHRGAGRAMSSCVRVGLQRDVVPEPLRLLVGVDVAPDPREQTDVVDDPRAPARRARAARPAAARSATGASRAPSAGPAQIGAQRQHRDQLRQPDARFASGAPTWRESKDPSGRSAAVGPRRRQEPETRSAGYACVARKRASAFT